MKTVLGTLLAAALVLAAFPAPLRAQATNAVLQGVVTDEQQGVLPGVAVNVLNVDTGLARDVVTDDRGWFRAVALPPGTYQLKATLEGFVPYERAGLVLTIGQEATVDVKLGVAARTESVTVTAAAPLIDVSSSALGTTVTKAQLDNLPLAGRNFSSLANLSPGVTGVGGGGVNAGGQLSRNNSFIIDGTSNDENAIADQRGAFSLEAVREYVVYTNQFAAEYGQASGAIVSVVTRSGTNNVEGRVFWFRRDDAFDAQNPFSHAQGSGKAPFSEQRLGGFLGGPLVKDKWHYFGSYERLRNETTSVITSPLVPADQREYPNKNRDDQYFFKTDYQINAKHTLSGRYRLDDAVNEGLGIGGLNPIERGYDYQAKFQDTVVNLTSVLSARTVNEARVQYGRIRRFYSVDEYADPFGVSISRPSGNFGKANNMPQGWNAVRYQFNDNLTYSVGRHDFKAGVDVQIDRSDVWFLGNKDGTFTFRTDTPFNAADPTTYPFQYTQTIGDWYDDRANDMYSGFIQDTWRLSPRLTLNLGLRYDTETLFAKADGIDVDQDRNNFSPRLGFVWSPWAGARTVVRGGFGTYYDQGFNNITGNIGISARSRTITILNPGYPDPYGQGTVQPQKPSLTVAAPAISTPSTRTYSVGFKHEIRSGLAVSVDGVRTQGYDLFNSLDINAAPAGTTIRPNPDYLRINQYQTTGRSWYDALLVAFERRSGRGPLFNLSYTLSKQLRNVEDFGFSPQDALNPAAERALASNNRTHQFVGSVTWALPWDFQIAALVQARSGLPWTVTTGSDNNGDTNVNDRPDLAVPGGNAADKSTYNAAFTGRVGNLGRSTNVGPSFAQVDARLSRFFRFGSYSFEGFVEAFNLANHANLGVPVGTLTSSSFGKATGLATSATPRQVELGVRFNF
jgi:hypothetical protein